MSPEPLPEPTPEVVAADPISWGYQDLLVFTFLSLLSILFSQLLMHLLTSALHLDPKSGAVLIPSQLLLYACLFTILFALIKLQYGREFWHSLRWRNSQIAPGAAFLLGFASSYAIQLVGLLLHTPNAETPIKKLLSSRAGVLEFGILAVTLGPLCEELVFRGFIQPVLVRSVGPTLGILVTASLFGALHLAQNSFIWQMGLLITLAGLAFGWMCQLTGSTKASTWMHAGFNSTVFVYLLQNPKLPHAQ